MEIDESKLYTVTEMAEIAKVSKASISKWLSKHTVNPVKEEGRNKYFKANDFQIYLDQHKANDNKQKELPTTTKLLQDQVSFLKKELTNKNRLIDELRNQIAEKDEEIKNISKKLGEIADQAQQLHLIDQKHILATDESIKKLTTTIEDSSKDDHRSFFSKLFRG